MPQPRKAPVIPDEVLAKDRLKIFVSSTIRECAAEREAVKDAILSVNHDPILFEDLGSQPYAPRRLYLARLRDSDIVIAIYKHEYGWIDEKGGMDISGLEDESRIARELGMPLLVYAHKYHTPRDERLRILVQEIMDGDQTVVFYERPEELRELVRDDVTRLLTHHFYGSVLQEQILKQTPAAIIELAAPAPTIVPRENLENDLAALLHEEKPIFVHGPAGIGKTVFLARFAETNGSIFVPASGLTPKELLGILANRLTDRPEDEALQFATLDGAKAAFMSAWTAANNCTVIVDDCQNISALLELIDGAGGLSMQKALVLSSRAAEAKDGISLLEIPPFSLEQATQLVRSVAQSSKGIAIGELYEKAQGNPLLLRQLTHPDGAGLIAQYENEADLLERMPARTRELVSYIALSPMHLTAEDLLQLCQDSEYSINALAADMKSAELLVREDVRGYTIYHERVRKILSDTLKLSPQKHIYLAERIARRLAKLGGYVNAYFVAKNAGSALAEKLSPAAVHAASRQGDFGSVRKILRDTLDSAIRDDDKRRIVEQSLAMSQAAQAGGDLKEAEHYLLEAERVADSLGDEDLSLRVREFIVSDRAQRHFDSASLSELNALKHQYNLTGRSWDEARIALILSAVQIGLQNYDKVVAEAEEAVKLFGENNDSYGADLARRNLASALAAIPGREGEASALISDLSTDTDKPDARRIRAWLCNVLVRRFRIEKRLQEALAHGEEAISIGEALGDQYLIAVNQIGVGNVYRDMGRNDQAIESYSTAGSIAQLCGRRDIEAQASRLTAAVYNYMADDAEGAETLELAGKAATFARHATGLLDHTVALGQRGRAFEELGDSLQSTGQRTEAADAYFRAAEMLREGGDPDEFERTLMLGSHVAIDAEALETYLDGVQRALGISPAIQLAGRAVIEALYAVTGQMVSKVDSHVAIPLLGLHFATMFRNLPPLIARHLFRKLLNDVLSNVQHDKEPWRLLFPALVLCSSLPAGHLRPLDLAQLSECVANKTEGMVYKPTTDGSAHWVLTLSFQEKVICSITTGDARTDTTMVAMFVALFLKGFEEQIASEVLGSMKPARRELAIIVSSVAEMPEDIRAFVMPHLEDQPCAVTRPGDMKDDTVPTFVTCRDDIGDQWGVGEGKGSALQIILGMTMLELVYTLLHGEIELDTLRPKIVSIVRQTVS